MDWLLIIINTYSRYGHIIIIITQIQLTTYVVCHTCCPPACCQHASTTPNTSFKGRKETLASMLPGYQYGHSQKTDRLHKMAILNILYVPCSQGVICHSSYCNIESRVYENRILFSYTLDRILQCNIFYFPLPVICNLLFFIKYAPWCNQTEPYCNTGIIPVWRKTDDRMHIDYYNSIATEIERGGMLQQGWNARAGMHAAVQLQQQQQHVHCKSGWRKNNSNDKYRVRHASTTTLPHQRVQCLHTSHTIQRYYGIIAILILEDWCRYYSTTFTTRDQNKKSWQ